jgi:HEAT repeat protein
VGTLEQPAPEAEVAKVLAILFKACDDPDTNLRENAAQCIGFCCADRPDLFTDPFIDELIRLLSNSDAQVRMQSVKLLAHSGTKGARAIPRLIEVLDDRSSRIRESAVRTLAELDSVEKLSAARLRQMSSGDSEIGCRYAATDTLEKFGLWPEKEEVGGEELRSR